MDPNTSITNLAATTIAATRNITVVFAILLQVAVINYWIATTAGQNFIVARSSNFAVIVGSCLVEGIVNTIANHNLVISSSRTATAKATGIITAGYRDIAATTAFARFMAIRKIIS